MALLGTGTSTVESLAEVFRCFICMEKLSDARLCPHCSKLCCYPCIRRWLTDQHQQCPHCRATLHLNDLVNCRWAEEVTSQLDTLKKNQIIKQKHEDKDKCELHHETLTVYCSSCSKCICHQCALFNQSHTGHNFLPIDDIYKINISILNEHLAQLKQRRTAIVGFVETIERNFETVKAAKDERFREIRNHVHGLHTNVEEKFQIQFNAVTAQRTQLFNEIELIEHTLHDIEYQLSSNGKAEIIDKQKEILNSIQTICEKPITNIVPLPISCDFPSEIVPRFSSSIFIIRNFSILQQSSDPVYSPSLHVNGLIWRLKVYPNGNGTVQGIYLSVFLELTYGLHESSKYEYRIEMIHQLSKDPSKNIIREFTSEFEIGECWGYNRYFLLNALISEGFHNTANDTLILRFHVRSPTYQQESRDQQWYIKSLENAKQQLNSEIKGLSEKIRSLTLENSNTEINGDLETVNDFNEIDDDEYTSIDSDQINFQDDENSSSLSNSTKIDTEEELNSSSHHQSNEIPITRSTISDGVQSNIAATKSGSLNETIRLFTSDPDFELADILERSTINEQDPTFHSNTQFISNSQSHDEISSCNIAGKTNTKQSIK